jgi:HTH-type transcriptional regulator / antitoxin HigA
MIKASGKMIAKAEGGIQTRRFNKRKYGELLAESVPTVIRTEEEYDHAIEQIEKLLKKRDRISAEEEHLLDLLSTLVEKYEDEHYPIEPAAPHEILQHLMEARDLKQKDIVHLFGSSGRASEAINGLRPISKMQAKALAEFFRVSTDLFLGV